MERLNILLAALGTAFSGEGAAGIAALVYKGAADRKRKNLSDLHILYGDASFALAFVEALQRTEYFKSSDHLSFARRYHAYDLSIKIEIDIDNARHRLRDFWEYVFSLERHGGLPTTLWSEEEPWLARAINYLRVMEPFDVGYCMRQSREYVRSDVYKRISELTPRDHFIVPEPAEIVSQLRPGEL